MARRLEKIEKELGYCDVKLEKERRLRKQIEFIDADHETLEGLLGFLSEHDPTRDEAFIRSPRETPSREAFLALGLFPVSRENLALLERERSEIFDRLSSFSGFGDKRRRLEEERRDSIKKMPPKNSSEFRKLDAEFHRTERVWKELAEDMNNLEEGVGFLERNLDYLKSCRNFLITAKGEYDLDSWKSLGYLTDLFRHSNLGRALEMADGADRNLQLAQRELVCLKSCRINLESYTRVLLRFMESLYEDLFITQRIYQTIQVVEHALANNLKYFDALSQKRASVREKLQEVAEARDALFARMGGDREVELVS